VFAVIKTGGKQYIVSPGKKLRLEKTKSDEKGAVVFDKVLMVADDKGGIEIGRPYIEGATVSAKVEKEGKAKKIIILKYKAKKRHKKKMGHRQPFTEVSIEKITAK